MIDDVASRTDTAHTHAHNGWLGMDQGSAGAFDKRLPQWTAPALLCSCPPALLQLLLLLLLLALLAACCWLVLADLSYVQQTIVCVCTYMHIRAYNMYMYIFRKRTYVCVCVSCVGVEGGSPPSPLLFFFLTFGRSFYPSLNAHTQAQGCHKAGSEV